MDFRPRNQHWRDGLNRKISCGPRPVLWGYAIVLLVFFTESIFNLVLKSSLIQDVCSVNEAGREKE